MRAATGKLIVIEGLEGAGKSTAINEVIALLSQHGIKTCITREPGGTAVGETLRDIIKNPEYQEILDFRTELLLLYAARMQLIQQVITPALQQGCWVIADRFELSTFAYQGGGRGLDRDFIKTLSAFCLEGFQPDLILYLDITPELGMQRAGLRGQFDRIEQQSMAFFHRVHAAYLQQIKTQSHTVTIDASCAIPEVQAAIAKAMADFIKANT